MSNYLSQRRRELGLTQKEVADAVGVAEATVSRWESGEIANMRRDRIVSLAKILNCSADFIMNGSNSASENNLPSPVPPGFSPLPEMASVPLVGQIACGQPITAEENLEGYVSIPSAWHATFTLMCKGDSMEPRIKDGDLVAIRSQPSVENGEIAAVRIDCEATLKHVYLYPDKIVLQPENPRYEPIVKIGEEMNDVHIEGKAVGLCRGL